jgi:hypothetical protein
MEFKNLKTLELYLMDIMNLRSISILEKIAEDYDLDKEELLNKYVEVNKKNMSDVNNTSCVLNDEEVSSSSDISSEEDEDDNIEDVKIKSNKKVLNKVIDDNFRCIAVTRMGSRCKRSKRNADYCNIHLKKMNVVVK